MLTLELIALELLCTCFALFIDLLFRNIDLHRIFFQKKEGQKCYQNAVLLIFCKINSSFEVQICSFEEINLIYFKKIKASFTKTILFSCHALLYKLTEVAGDHLQYELLFVLKHMHCRLSNTLNCPDTPLALAEYSLHLHIVA